MNNKRHGSGSVDPSEKREIDLGIIEVMKESNISEGEIYKAIKCITENPEFYIGILIWIKETKDQMPEKDM